MPAASLETPPPTEGVSVQIATVGLLFFVLGFFTWMNGPLITFVKLAFDLTDVGAFLVPMVFYLSYFFLALPSASILRRTGLKAGMVIGLLLMAAGAAIFGQFATVRIYPGALAGLFVIGGGLAMLQTAVNPYISILGPIESAARRIALMGICNKTAGILAPVVLGAVALGNIGSLAARVAAAPDGHARDALLDGFAAHIHGPYLVMAGALGLLALVVARSPLPELRPDERNEASPGRGGTSRGLRAPHLWFGVLCLFLYVGVEVMAGDAIGTYGRYFHLPLDQTKFFTSFTLGAMLLGYLAGLLLIPRAVSQERYLALSAIAGLVLTVAACLTSGYPSVGCVAALGFANAMMWPAIFPLGIRGLGAATGLGSAFMIMGICGGAILPQIFVVLKQFYPMQAVFGAVMLPAYAFILFYGLRGARLDPHAAPDHAPAAALRGAAGTASR